METAIIILTILLIVSGIILIIAISKKHKDDNGGSDGGSGGKNGGSGGKNGGSDGGDGGDGGDGDKEVTCDEGLVYNKTYKRCVTNCDDNKFYIDDGDKGHCSDCDPRKKMFVTISNNNRYMTYDPRNRSVAQFFPPTDTQNSQTFTVNANIQSTLNFKDTNLDLDAEFDQSKTTTISTADGYYLTVSDPEAPSAYYFTKVSKPEFQQYRVIYTGDLDQPFTFLTKLAVQKILEANEEIQKIYNKEPAKFNKQDYDKIAAIESKVEVMPYVDDMNVLRRKATKIDRKFDEKEDTGFGFIINVVKCI